MTHSTVCLASLTLARRLTIGPVAEACTLQVCQYFTYKVRYTNSTTEIPEFVIAPEVALELLMAANFLDC